MNSETLKKVLKLRFSLKKKSQRFFLGSYRSAFKGTGVTFSDFRAYEYGDDLRSISWPLTAKMGKPYVKLFEEERGLTFVLMVDVSASSFFGSSEKTKQEVIQEIATLLAFSAEKNQDQVGLLLFTDQIEFYIPPSKGRRHILKIVEKLHSFKPKYKKTSLKTSCSYMCRVLKKRSTIFLLSDLLVPDLKESLKFLSYKHDLNIMIPKDPLEQQIPSLGLVDVVDSETGEKMVIDTSSKRFQQDYKNRALEIQENQENNLKQLKLNYCYLQTNEDTFKSLMKFFNQSRGL